VSLVFELPDKSGSLYGLLGNFIFNGINMVKIESRPVPGKKWQYRFFIDIEGNLSDPAVMNALYGIREEAAEFKILGNY
jgi:chorismate mutase/prephenate dehydratase